jgi:hypothetical protein
MAKEIVKLLGQVDVAAVQTEYDVYAVPQNRSAVVTVSVCNRTGGAVAYRLAVVPGTSASPVTSVENYIRFDKALAANDDEDIKIGISLDEFDIIRVESDAHVNISVSVFGVEIGQDE